MEERIFLTQSSLRWHRGLEGNLRLDIRPTDRRHQTMLALDISWTLYLKNIFFWHKGARNWTRHKTNRQKTRRLYCEIFFVSFVVSLKTLWWKIIFDTKAAEVTQRSRRDFEIRHQTIQDPAPLYLNREAATKLILRLFW